MNKPPFILTLTLPKKDADYFNSLRQKHFPADRNFIDAHLTLFHSLPNELTVIDSLNKLCLDQSVFDLRVKEPVSIGKGVAFKIESTALMTLHKALQKQWLEVLTLQDKHTIWPHITVQNKVGIQEAKTLLDELRQEFKEFETIASGLQLWEYLGGPWKFVQSFSFVQAQGHTNQQ